MYSSSYIFSAGTTKSLYHALLAAMTIGSNPLILLSSPSSHTSPKNSHSSRSCTLVAFSPMIDHIKATVIGMSKLVPDLRISDGERLSINLRGGISKLQILSADLIRSLDSLIIASGSHIISIVGNDLLVPISMMISWPISPSIVYVFTLWIMLRLCCTNVYKIGYKTLLTSFLSWYISTIRILGNKRRKINLTNKMHDF